MSTAARPDLVHDAASAHGVRAPARLLLITLIQPVVWLFLFGNLFKKVVELGGFGTTSYLDYLVPGVVVMSALSSNMWAGMAHAGRDPARHAQPLPDHTGQPRRADERQRRAATALVTALQSVIIVLLGPRSAAPTTRAASAECVDPGRSPSVLLGTVFGALSNALGMLVRERESIIGINTFLLLPLTFLSSAFMAPAQMPSWMRHIADFNPLNWAMVAGRSAMSGRPGLGRRAQPRRRAARAGGGRGVAVDPHLPLVPAVGVSAGASGAASR